MTKIEAKKAVKKMWKELKDIPESNFITHSFGFIDSNRGCTVGHLARKWKQQPLLLMDCLEEPVTTLDNKVWPKSRNPILAVNDADDERYTQGNPKARIKAYFEDLLGESLEEEIVELEYTEM